jgi:hypothetical protein
MDMSHAARSTSCFRFAAFLGLLVLHLSGQLGWAKDDKRFSKGAKAASEAKQELINQELKTLEGHSWAGRYYYGDGLGVNVDLDLAPKSGFVFTWNGCLGLYDLNYGDVAEGDGKIRLVFKYANDRKGFQGIAPELIPVVWGERRYLIPRDEIVKFANDINAGFEPRKTLWGSFLLRRGDELKDVLGQPSIPAEYTVYLLRNPIKAKISSIKGSRFKDSTRTTTVVLNVGSEQGVKLGMEFYLYSPSTIFESATITRLETSSSEAVIVQYALNDESETPPSLDWKLSTFVGCDGVKDTPPLP